LSPTRYYYPRAMFARLFPSEGKGFFDYFEQHAAKTVEAARLLEEMLAKPDDLPSQARPIDRGDIHRLISRLDDVLDLIEATSERVWLYGLDTPEHDAIQLAQVLMQAVAQVSRAMVCLRNLKDRDALLQICMEINRYENEGDTLLRTALARLFREQKDPVMIIKWKDIYDFLENAVDRCEDVANVLEGVALEYA
jgi:uncharacterized protein Yka (UPF0111/DUF47 family)